MTSNINKPVQEESKLQMYHIFFYDKSNGSVSKGVNIWGKDITEVLKIFLETYPENDIIYIMNKTDEIK